MVTRIELQSTTKTKNTKPASQKQPKRAKKTLEILNQTKPQHTPMMFNFTKDQLLDGGLGKPLITGAYDRGFGRGYQSTGEAVPIADLKKELKNNKKLDKDMRTTIELEIKRQENGGYLPAELRTQWIELCNRKIEEGRQRAGTKLNLNL